MSLAELSADQILNSLPNETVQILFERIVHGLDPAGKQQLFDYLQSDLYNKSQRPADYTLFHFGYTDKLQNPEIIEQIWREMLELEMEHAELIYIDSEYVNHQPYFTVYRPVTEEAENIPFTKHPDAEAMYQALKVRCIANTGNILVKAVDGNESDFARIIEDLNKFVVLGLSDIDKFYLTVNGKSIYVKQYSYDIESG